MSVEKPSSGPDRPPLVARLQGTRRAAFECAARDLTGDGMFVPTARDLPPGEDLRLLVVAPDGRRGPPELPVVVQRADVVGGVRGVVVALSRRDGASERLASFLFRLRREEGESVGVLRVYVIDDVPVMRTIYRQALDRVAEELGGGVEVEFAAGGKEALERVGRSPAFSLLVLDLYMPGIDGFQVIRRVRETPQCRDTKIAVITVGEDEDRARVAALGVEVCLQKPVGFQTLVSTFSRLLVPPA